ncbi:MAG: DUF402 domain-containing protein, partial [Dehalococcoidia bacterium]
AAPYNPPMAIELPGLPSGTSAEPFVLPPLDPSTGGHPVRVLSTKYDGSQHYEYRGILLDERDGVLRIVVEEGTPLVGYRGAGAFRCSMTQLFFTDRWYNVEHNYRPIGRYGMRMYANIATPARLEGDTIHWIDLDLDVVDTESRGLYVDDEDEFAAHSVEMRYPDEVVAQALAARDEVLALARTGVFPLDRASHLPPSLRPPPSRGA